MCTSYSVSCTVGFDLTFSGLQIVCLTRVLCLLDHVPLFYATRNRCEGEDLHVLSRGANTGIALLTLLHGNKDNSWPETSK